MDPLTMMMVSAAAPAVTQMLMPRRDAPGGPDYSAAMAYMNSPEMLAYRNSMLRSAYDPQSDIYQQASNQALAQSNRIAASRGLGTSGAGIGFAQNTQNDLARKFQEGEFQRRLQAYQAAISGGTAQGNMMMNMADKNYAAQMGNYNRAVDNDAAMIGSVGSITNNMLSAYEASQMRQRGADAMSGFAARSPGYGGQAGMVFNAPVSSGGYNYPTYGGYP